MLSDSRDNLIDIMETDKDHIHLLVSYPPKVSISSIVRKLKQVSTISLWEHNPLYLSKCYWKQHSFAQMDTSPVL